MASPQFYGCPECGQVDMVQKVSALVEGGTTAGIYSNIAGVHVAGISSSAKASQLAPPRRPTYKSSWGFFPLVITGLGIFWGGAFVAGIFAVLILPRFGDLANRLAGVTVYIIGAAFA